MSNLKHKYILCPDVLELISKNEELESRLAAIAAICQEVTDEYAPDPAPFEVDDLIRDIVEVLG